MTIDKLPGGDATRRTTLARITLTNTAEGVGEVRVYRVRVGEADDRARVELAVEQCRTHREADEGVLRLVHRALGALLGQS